MTAPDRSGADFPASDLLDRQIAAMLAQDARISFRRIAAELGVTEGTVRGRMKRLQGSGLLKLMPIIDISSDNGHQMLFLTVTCEPGMLAAVRDGMLAMPLVRCLYDVNAGQQLTAFCIVGTLAEAARMTSAVTALPGARTVSCEVVLATVKFNASIGAIATVEDALLGASGMVMP